MIGFSAERYQDSDSEFDSVFKSDEGLFLGEAEGKDTKAIDVTKIRQLTTNIQEYYDKFDEFPKGILFGNAFRFTNPNERGEFFTTKCLTMAKQFNITLIQTTDLFKITQHLKENDDDLFKKLCRLKILETTNTVVKFPEISTKKTEGKIKTRKSTKTS